MACIATEGLEVLKSMLPRIITNKGDDYIKERVTKAFEVYTKFYNDRDIVNYKTGNRWTDQTTDLKDKIDAPLADSIGKVLNSKDPDVKAKVNDAMNMASMLTMKSMIDYRMENSSKLEDDVKATFGIVLGEIGTAEYDARVEDVVNMIRRGKAIPTSMFARSAGSEAIRQLELKFDTKLSRQVIRDIETTLGEVVIDNMLPKSDKILTINRMVVAEVQSGEGTELELTEPIEQQEGVESTAVRVMDLSKLDKGYTKELAEAAMVFEYMGDRSDGMIDLEPVLHDETKLTRNSDMPVSEDTVEYLNAQGSNKYKFNREFAEVWAEAGEDVNALKEMILGKKEDLIANTASQNVESELAKYESEELEIERMLMAYELVENEEFYLGWDYTVSNRNMIANKMLNPQNSKISRFLTGMEDMRMQKDMNELTQAHLDMMNIASAQAIDIGIDKTTDVNALEELKEEFGEFKKTEDGVTFEVAKGKEWVYEGGVTLAKVKEATGLGSGHVMHAYQAYKLAEQVLNGSESIDTSLALEVDGITNGMASTLMQVGLTEETRELLEKAGVYIGSSVKGHGEFIDNGGVDIYSTPIDGIQSAMVTGITDTISTILGANSKDIEVLRNVDSTREEYEAAEKSINKKWRNFMKGPVMIFIYGASMKNIRRAIARSLITGNSYIKGGMQSGKIAEIAELAGMRYEEKLDRSGKVVARVLINDAKGKSYPLTYKKYDAEKGMLVRTSDTDVKNIVLEEWMIGMLTSAIEKNIGKAVEDSFKKSFGPAVKYRKALKTVNELKYVLSKVRLAERLNGKKYHDLSKEELTEIKNRMRDEGTYYGSENPVGGMQDYFKEKDNLRDEVEPIQVKIHTKNFQSANGHAKLVNRILKEMGSNVGAIGVIDIHAVDGGVMIKGHRAKVLNLFDALILGLDPEVNKEQIQALNEAFYQINMEHSIIGKAVESTVEMMKKVDITKAMEIPGLASEIEEDLRRIQEADKDASVVELIHGMVESIEELKNIDIARRAMMETQGVQVNQYYGTDLVEAKAGDDVEVNKDGRWYVLNDKDVEVLQKGVAVVGEVMQSNYVKMLEEVVEEVSKTDTGFQGYVGGFDGKGKTTVEGDGKDKAMREVADVTPMVVPELEAEYTGLEEPPAANKQLDKKFERDMTKWPEEYMAWTETLPIDKYIKQISAQYEHSGNTYAEIMKLAKEATSKAKDGTIEPEYISPVQKDIDEAGKRFEGC